MPAGASVPDALITSTVFVVDTSVLLADPLAVTRFAEHEVVLPLVVLTELEGKRHHPELGWAARRSLRLLEDFRTRHGSLIEPMPVNDEGGSLRVELNHQDLGALPQPLRADSNDHRILSVALSLVREGRDVVVVSKDLPLRLKAAVVGLAADEYRNELASDSGWTGFVELDVWGSVIDELFEQRVVDLAEARDLPCHAGVALHSGSQSALARVHPDKQLHLVRADQSMFDLRGRSGGAAHRHRPARRRTGRHRQPRWHRGHRQERARAWPRGSKRSSSGAHTSAWSCSARSTRSVDRILVTSPGRRPRRCRRGGPRSPMRSRRWWVAR